MRPSEDQFFTYLREKTDKEFLKSDIYKKQLGLGEQWNYSICATSIKPHKGLVFGLNWGARSGYKYSRQGKMPDDTIKGWPYANRVRGFVSKYLDSTIEELNYSNLCFFRSQNISQLTKRDWEQSRNLFAELVEYIRPPWILLTGIDGFPHLLPDAKVEEHLIVKDGDKSQRVILMLYKGITNLAVVPHPNARMSTECRITLWKKAGEFLLA